MPSIQNIACHKVVNSRGDWTIETRVTLTDGSFGSQIVPEGASKGEREAIYIPVGKAVDIVTSSLSELLLGENPFDQVKIDEMMIDVDGTSNKRNFGANSILSVSLAVCKAAASSRGVELYEYVRNLFGGRGAQLSFPVPLFNVINGGRHADNNLSFQEFMLVPAKKFSFEKAMEIGVALYDDLERHLDGSGISTEVGDEGGFAPEGFTAEKTLSLIKAVASKRFKVGDEVFFGCDAAADSFRRFSRYLIREENLSFDGRTLLDFYRQLLSKFELVYLEDPFYERDAESWQKITEELGSRTLVVADDLTVTNPAILKEVIKDKLCNAVIVKPNQVGTLTETLKFIKIAKDAGLVTVISHRSGDSGEDTFIADLALAVGADFMKAGAPARGERVAKYNRLLDVFQGLS